MTDASEYFMDGGDGVDVDLESVVLDGRDVLASNDRRFCIEAAMAVMGVPDTPLAAKERDELLRMAARMYRFMSTGETSAGAELTEVRNV